MNPEHPKFKPFIHFQFTTLHVYEVAPVVTAVVCMLMHTGYRSIQSGKIDQPHQQKEFSKCLSVFLWKSPGSTSSAGLLVLQMTGSSFSRRLHLSSKHLNAYT